MWGVRSVTSSTLYIASARLSRLPTRILVTNMFPFRAHVGKRIIATYPSLSPFLFGLTSLLRMHCLKLPTTQIFAANSNAT